MLSGQARLFSTCRVAIVHRRGPAVRSARTALAAIVAEHPELTGATARARLAANLPEILAMKPLDPNATGAARTITVRLSADLIAQLEAERDRLAALVPGSSLGLSDAVRSLIHRALATPSTSSPAPSPAPAPSRPIVAGGWDGMKGGAL